MSSRAAPIIIAVVFGPKLFKIVTAALKSAKAAKLGLGVASMAAYSWLFTWEFAILIMVSLIIHEYGHIWAMRAVGIPTKGIYLIPFVGGAAVSERAFKNRMEEQFVAIAGPIFGLAQGCFLYLLYLLLDLPLLGAAAGWVALFNVFNLLPIPPLDGGRIVKSATFSIGKIWGLIFMGAGFAGAFLLMLLMDFWLLGVIAIVSFFEILWEARASGRDGEFHVRRMDRWQVLQSLGLYVMVIAAFVALMVASSSVPEGKLALQIMRSD
ncbi:MAG: site-2 protease family protein [Alphaproteobacteria bacterium]|nr:site-2 protease family protein [Alphaproteobacteria bacterium]